MTAHPAPLTQPECDLRDFPFMPLEVGQLLDSETWLMATGDEAKAAVTLWCKSWHQVPAASLPNNDRILALLSGAGVKWKKVREVALRGFVLCSDGRLYHHVIATKATESWSRKLSQRDRTRAATDARNVKRHANVTLPANESRNVNVTDDVTETKGQGERHRQGQKKQEPVTKSGSGSSGSGSSGSGSSGSETSDVGESASTAAPIPSIPRTGPPPCLDVPEEDGVERGFERALLDQMQPKLLQTRGGH